MYHSMDQTYSVGSKRESSNFTFTILLYHFRSQTHTLSFFISFTMPCLTLRKGLFPSIKAWKAFTTKLLQKLHPCKIIKITRTRRAKVTKTPPPMYYPPFPSNKTRHRRKAKDHRQLFGVSKALHRPKQHHRFKKQSFQAPPPVFIDELFWSHPGEAQPCSSLSVFGRAKTKAEPGISSSLEESIQLRGIDARAEEFITRFRAELEIQEIVAHDL